VTLCAVVLVGCLDNPTIQGSTVPLLDSSTPSCSDVCTHLQQLCGYAPLGDQCSNADASGYCDTEFTSDQMACIGQATSCAQAWDPGVGGCAYVPPVVDAGPDVSTDDGSTDDSGDAATE
jgi:hypothetical protein